MFDSDSLHKIFDTTEKMGESPKKILSDFISRICSNSKFLDLNRIIRGYLGNKILVGYIVIVVIIGNLPLTFKLIELVFTYDSNKLYFYLKDGQLYFSSVILLANYLFYNFQVTLDNESKFFDVKLAFVLLLLILSAAFVWGDGSKYNVTYILLEFAVWFSSLVIYYSYFKKNVPGGKNNENWNDDEKSRKLQNISIEEIVGDTGGLKL